MKKQFSISTSSGFIQHHFLGLRKYFSTFISQLSTSYGFTLIELLVVLAISSLLIGVSITSYVSVNKRQTVEQEAQNFKQFFDEAKNNATSFVKPANCSGVVVMGYEVTVDTVGKQLLMRGVCGTLDPTPVPSLNPTPAVVKTLDLSKYTIISGGGCNQFFYGVLKNTYTCGVGGSNQPSQTFTIKETGETVTKTITIDQNGNAQITP